MGSTSAVKTPREAEREHRVILHWPRTVHLSDDQLYDFCRANRELRIERNAAGDCVIMAPTGGETSWRNSRLITLLSIWAERDGSGVVFDSSGGFILRSGAIRSPDVSWIAQDRLASLTSEQKQRFLPICPDFVLELASPSDDVSDLQVKMEEYIASGARLGWLIDAGRRGVFRYLPETPPDFLTNLGTLSGEPVLKGFVLELMKIWEVGF